MPPTLSCNGGMTLGCPHCNLPASPPSPHCLRPDPHPAPCNASHSVPAEEAGGVEAGESPGWALGTGHTAQTREPRAWPGAPSLDPGGAWPSTDSLLEPLTLDGGKGASL